MTCAEICDFALVFEGYCVLIREACAASADLHLTHSLSVHPRAEYDAAAAARGGASLGEIFSVPGKTSFLLEVVSGSKGISGPKTKSKGKQDSPGMRNISPIRPPRSLQHHASSNFLRSL